jgi:hypothetical protein
MRPCRRRWLLRAASAWPGVGLGLAWAQAAPPAPPTPSLIERLLRITGLALAPGQLRGPEDAVGSVWVVDVRGTTPPVRWTQASVYRSPVFAADGRSLYALQDDRLVRLDAPGRAPVALQRLPGVRKLVGLAEGELLLLRQDLRQPLAALPLATPGAEPRLLPIDPDAEDARRLLGRMRGESRGTEQFTVGPQRQQREGTAGRIEWHDIVLQPRAGGAARNLSRSDGIDCAQPALDARAERLAYILADG